MHVLVVGDTEQQVLQAVQKVERILFADEATRELIRKEQMSN